MDYRKLKKAELVTLLELRDKPIVAGTPKTIYDFLKPYSKKQQEHFIVVMLDSALHVKNLKVVGVGVVNKVLVHPREVFCPAIENMASAIVIAHNHPSGDTNPSEEDFEVTTRLKKVGELIGIEVLDHMIFSDTNYHSMADAGEMYF